MKSDEGEEKPCFWEPLEERVKGRQERKIDQHDKRRIAEGDGHVQLPACRGHCQKAGVKQEEIVGHHDEQGIAGEELHGAPLGQEHQEEDQGYREQKGKEDKAGNVVVKPRIHAQGIVAGGAFFGDLGGVVFQTDDRDRHKHADCRPQDRIFSRILHHGDDPIQHGTEGVAKGQKAEKQKIVLEAEGVFDLPDIEGDLLDLQKDHRGKGGGRETERGQTASSDQPREEKEEEEDHDIAGHEPHNGIPYRLAPEKDKVFEKLGKIGGGVGLRGLWHGFGIHEIKGGKDDKPNDIRNDQTAHKAKTFFGQILQIFWGGEENAADNGEDRHVKGIGQHLWPTACGEHMTEDDQNDADPLGPVDVVITLFFLKRHEIPPKAIYPYCSTYSTKSKGL